MDRNRHHYPRRLLLAVIAALALTVAACANNPAEPDADGDWVLVSGHGPDGEIEVVDGHEPTMIVNGFEVSGHAGCNQFGIAGEEEPEEWPTEFFSTMMACDPPEVMEQESQFLDAMRQITDVQADGDELLLSGPDTELHFERTSV